MLNVVHHTNNLYVFRLLKVRIINSGDTPLNGQSDNSALVGQ